MVSLRTRSPSSGRVSPAPTPLASSRPPVPHVRNGAILAGFGLGPSADGRPTRKDDALDYSIADLVAIAYRRGLEGGSVEGDVVQSSTDHVSAVPEAKSELVQ